MTDSSLTDSSSSPFGGWAISKQLFEWVLSLLPEKSTILELGSGSGTQQLARHFRMVSVEHDPDFVGRYDSTYIYAPIVNGWYDAVMIGSELSRLSVQYDLLLVDGPPKQIGRTGILLNLGLFDLTKPIVLDDVHRAPEIQLLDELATHVGRRHTIFADGSKSFGVL